MLWKVFHIDGKYCVYKHDAQGNRIGDALGSHDKPQEANTQIQALYASIQRKDFSVPVSLLSKLCPSCGDKFRELGVSTVTFQAGTEVSQKLCDAIGGAQDPGFFTKCMDSSAADNAADPEAFCAWLHKQCTGIWPGEHRGQQSEIKELEQNVVLAASGIALRQEDPLPKGTAWDVTIIKAGLTQTNPPVYVTR